jgi:D-serine deaminase-like pyridoxal phosphate-dependent protein
VRPTPALVLDVDALDANLAAMQARCSQAGVALRPHVKGHKCAWVAARQLRAGAVGFAAATLEEAGGLVRAGLGGDVLLTSVVSPRAVAEIVALQAAGDVAVVASEPAFVDALRDAGASVRVLVDVDVGQGRSGVTGAQAAVAVAERIRPPLRYAGVQAYEGHLQFLDREEQARGHASALEALGAVVGALRAAGLEPPVVTGAGTGTVALALDAPGGAVTEVQPGSYALMDATYARTAGGAGFRQAAFVETTVRSRAVDAVVVDAGLKAVSTDMGPAAVDGLDARWAPAGDEHGLVRGDVATLVPGDRVRLVPSHTDTTVRLHRALWAGDVALPVF